VAAEAGGPRIRGRAVAVLVLSAAVVASGVALDRLGPRPAGAAPPGPYSGAWFCPHGGGPAWQGWLAVTNPGPSPARVRVTSFGAGSQTGSQTFVVGPSSQAYRPIDASEPGAATEVEYFGAWVSAATVVQTKGSRPFDTAGRCVGGPHSTWLMPDESTGEGETAYIVVLNPFDTSAEFRVVLRTEQRTIRPGSLTPEVLRPGRSEAIKVNQFVLEGPGERTVTAQVITQVGRVVAGSLVSSSTGLRSEAGLTVASGRWIVPAGGYGASSDVLLLNPGSGPAALSLIEQGEAGTAVVGGLGRQTLAPGRAATIQAPGTLGGGMLISSTNGGEVAAAMRVSGPNGDDATITGATAPARAWVVPPTAPASGGSALLVLHNPGARTVQVQIRLLGPQGEIPSSLGPVSVAPGRQMIVQEFVSGGAPVSAVVTATGQGIVAGGASTSLSGRGFAATVGVPIPRRRA
jgi:hypothetical protein